MTNSIWRLRAKIKQIEEQLEAIKARGGGVADSTIQFLEDKWLQLKFALFLEMQRRDAA